MMSNLTREISEQRLLPGTKKTLIIINPNSQGGNTGKNSENLSKIIGNYFKNSEIILTKKPFEATLLTRDYLKKGYNEIVAVGGDGTINEVANGFFEFGNSISNLNKESIYHCMFTSSFDQINPNSILTIIPTGTRNVLANYLGFPQNNDLEKLCKWISTKKPKTIDVIGATATKSNNEIRSSVFLNAAEIGMPAEIITRSKKVRSAINNRLLSTILGIIATIPTYTNNKCDFRIDNKEFSSNMTLCIVSNSKYLGGHFKVAPRASIRDGLLDIVIGNNSGSLKSLKRITKMKKGVYFDDEKILYLQGKKIFIKSQSGDNVNITIDGEPLGMLPAFFSVIPKSLKIRT